MKINNSIIFQEGVINISITLFVILGIFAIGCRPTLNVVETDTEQIEEKLIDYQNEEAIGSEVTLLLKDGESISGELLSVRDSSIILCEEYSATEEELAIQKFPIKNVRTDKIVECEIKGNTYPLWIGAGIGLVAGTVVYLLVKDDLKIKIGTSSDDDMDKAASSCCLVGGLTTLPLIIGRGLSTEDMTLTDIPTGYKFLPLKSLARYQSGEPEYLKAIK